MIKSMTGFAAGSRELETATLGITARTVNHRYLDVQVRLPPLLASIEVELRGVVQRWVARGRVEVAVTDRRPVTRIVSTSPDAELRSATGSDSGAAEAIAPGATATRPATQAQFLTVAPRMRAGAYRARTMSDHGSDSGGQCPIPIAPRTCSTP